MRIGNREIGINHRPYIIAEIGVNHDGDVERALELTDAAADANADAIKLQFFETDRLMSKAAKLAAYQKNAGETDPIEMLRRLELNIDEMARVVERAHSKNIHAIVTVFSTELVEIAETLPWDAYKTASPDIVNKPLLEALMQTGKPMIVSTGASTMEEVICAVDWLDSARDRLAVLQCVSSYPAPKLELGGIRAIAEKTRLPTGYSDHTKSHRSGNSAVCAGACILEKHITDDRGRLGPDHNASLLTMQLNAYCEMSRSAVAGRATFCKLVDAITQSRSVDPDISLLQSIPKDLHNEAYPVVGAENLYLAGESDVIKRVLDCEQDVRTVSRQSVVTTTDIPSGTTITRDMLTIKRPGTGILACNLESVIGCTTSQPIEADVPIQETDLVQFEPALASV
jgi:N,N'-diacetyllegionaminate synthase